MALHMVKSVPTPQEIREVHPMDKELISIKAERDAEIKKVLRENQISFLQ